MNDQLLFKRVAVISAFSAAISILASTVILFSAVDFETDFLSSPVDLITLDADAVETFRWGSIVETFGYFVLLIPVTLYLWYWLRPRSPRLVTLYTVFGVVAITFGGLGSLLRATLLPEMINSYVPEATVANEPDTLLIVFQASIDFIFEGLYSLDSIAGGIWWLGIGYVLYSEKRALGIATIVMGLPVLLAGIGWLTQIDPLARLELFYFFEPFWLIWLGVLIMRDTDET